MLPVSSATPQALPKVLIADADPFTSTCLCRQRGLYAVTTVASVGAALAYLAGALPSLVITELKLTDGSAVDICRRSKDLVAAPTVLVTTSDVGQVPDVLLSGCDSVLLKPFAPNLLYARIGHLIRMRASRHLIQSARQVSRTEARILSRLLSGTNRIWPDTQCPRCNQNGVTSFEFASHRRAWYACLDCRNVWVAKRQE